MGGWRINGNGRLTGTGRIFSPCTGDELAAELRRVNRPLLVRDQSDNPLARGQLLDRTRLDELARRREDLFPTSDGRKFPWSDNRWFLVSWDDLDFEWMLVEDLETTEYERLDALAEQEAANNGSSSD